MTDVAPGDDQAYHYVAAIDALPGSDPDMYAVYETGVQLCVYRNSQWWCSPTDAVREFMPWLVP